MYLVSVIIPTFNDARFLEDCVSSVLTQTARVTQIIIVDDGTDNQADLIRIENLKKIDNRIVVESQANSGPASARNTGIRASTGDFVTFVDADDRLRHDCIERRLRLLADSGEAAAAYCGFEAIDSSGTKTVSSFASIEAQCADADLVGRKDGIPGGLPFYLFRKSVLSDLGGLDESLSHMEDFDLIIRLLKAGHKLVGQNSPTYIRVKRRGSHSRASREKRLLGALTFLRKAQSQKYFSTSELIRRALATFGQYVAGVRYLRTRSAE